MAYKPFNPLVILPASYQHYSEGLTGARTPCCLELAHLDHIIERHAWNPIMFENCLERLGVLSAFAPNFNTLFKALPAFLGLQLVLVDGSLRSNLHNGCADYNNCADYTHWSLRRVLHRILRSVLQCILRCVLRQILRRSSLRSLSTVAERKLSWID